MNTEELCAEIERLDVAATAGPWATTEKNFDGDKEMARELLQERWNEMMDSANDGQQNISLGYLLAFFHMGHVNEIEAEAWQERFKRCPGHVGGRRWCAYCGDVESDTEER